MPAVAAERVAEYVRVWAERGIRAWGEGWWTMPLTVGDQIGRIVGAPPGSVTMHQNVTIAEAIVLSCFRLEPPRNRIVYEAGNFPSVRYRYQAHADRAGALCGHSRLRRDRGGRRGADPPAVARADLASRPAPRACRIRGRKPARHRPARRDRDRTHARVRGGPRRAGRARDPLRP